MAIDVNQLKLLIFDLDGVITSEKKYWQTARLTVWEIIAGKNYLGISNYFGESGNVSTRLAQVGARVIPDSFIYELKSRAVNSNWDLTFFVVCLHLVGILSQFQTDSWFDVLNEDCPIEKKLNRLGSLITQSATDDSSLQASSFREIIPNSEFRIPNLIEQFWEETRSLRGTSVLDYVSLFAEQTLGGNFPCFEPKGELWQLCYGNFQAWYEGKKGYTLPEDETVLDLSEIDAALQNLYNSGRFTLAIATGRPRNEVIAPMTALGLLQYFDPQRIVTYDDVLEAEARLTANKVKLGKPHPFVLFKAVYPNQVELATMQLPNGQEIAYIGDAGSDVVAAKRAGCLAIGVLTGFAEGEARKSKQKLEDLGCDIILNSILELPQLLGVHN